MTRYEGIIVGAGIVGVSIAYHLSKLGYKKLLIVDKGGIASGVTGICPGGVRQQWGTEINCRMAKASVHFYENMNAYLEPEETIVYKSVGYMNIFHSDEEVENYKKNKALQNRLGIPTEFLTPEEAARIIPGIDQSSFQVASFCKTDGFVDDANHVTKSLAEAAKRRGTTVMIDDVKRMILEGERVIGIDTAKHGEIHADFVVNAAGLGSKSFAETAGIQLPITFDTRRILYTNQIKERLIEPLLISFKKGFAGKQFSNGVMYMSYLGKTEKKLSVLEFQKKVLEVGVEIFPSLEQVAFKTHVDGVYDSTPDHQAIIGDVDGIDGYYQAVGMSGHGFMMAPSIGETLADVIAGNDPSIDIQPLHMNRFKENRLIFEPSVV